MRERIDGVDHHGGLEFRALGPAEQLRSQHPDCVPANLIDPITLAS